MESFCVPNLVQGTDDPSRSTSESRASRDGPK